MLEPEKPTEAQPDLTLVDVETSKPEHRLRRMFGVIAICVGGLAVGAALGAAVGLERPTHTSVAGNDASAVLEIGSEIHNVDVAIARGYIPSKVSIAGLPISVRLRLQAGESLSTAENPDEKAETAILQTFSDFGQEAHQIGSDIKRHVTDDSRNGASLGLIADAFGLGGYVLAKNARARMSKSAQAEQYHAYKYFRQVVKAVAILGVGTVAYSGWHFVGSDINANFKNRPALQANPAFEGTALEGAEITGLAAPFVDSAINLLAENNKFYSELENNFMTTADAYLASATLPKGPNTVVMTLVADRHCNVGMDRVITAATKAFGAQIIVRAGDDALWSSPWPVPQSACISGLVNRAKSQDLKMVGDIGNHDSHTPKNLAYKRDGTIVDASTKVIDTPKGEITFLSSPDPRHSQFGNDLSGLSSAEQHAMTAKQGVELGKLACANPMPIDILITHDPNAADSAVENGCQNIRFTFSGHTHHRKLRKDGINNIYKFTEGSSGGATTNGLSIGPLKSSAKLSVLYYNTKEDRPEGIVLIKAFPNKTVEIEDFRSFGNTPPDYRSANRF